MRNSSLRAACCLAFLFPALLGGPPRLAAMESGTGSAASGAAGGSGALAAAPAKEWKLGISLFSRLSSLPDSAVSSLDDLQALRAAAGANDEKLGSSLSDLLREVLEPLPRFRGDSSPAARSVGTKAVAAVSEGTLLRLVRPSSGAAHFDPAGSLSEAATLDGLILGFYQREGERISIAIYLAESGRIAPGSRISWEGSFETLDRFAPAVVPRIAAWAAGRTLAIVDFYAEGPGLLQLAAPQRTEEGAASFFELQGSRLYLYRETAVEFSASMAGHASLDLALEAREMGTMERQKLRFAPKKAAVPPSATMAKASGDLAWAAGERFNKAEQGFRNALTRLVLSLPVSILCTGWFVTVNQAWVSYGASDAALYSSGAAAGAALALSIGFFVDLSLRLADVLAAAR